jgi:hypothetical protein
VSSPFNTTDIRQIAKGFDNSNFRHSEDSI